MESNQTINHLESQLIINQEFFESIREMVICQICHGVLINPLSCSCCESNFCNHCLKTWKSQTNNNLCPMKCTTNKFTSPGRVLKNLLDKLQFNCKNNCGEKKFSYSEILIHLNDECELSLINCTMCKSKVKLCDYKKSDFHKELQYQKEQITLLIEENKRLKQEKEFLNKNYNILKAEYENKTAIPIVINNNNKNHYSQLELIDKCLHFKGNYMPIFTCCDKSFPCYICHQEVTNHAMEISNKVICLYCKEIYSGNQCTSCGTYQLYKKKFIV